MEPFGVFILVILTGCAITSAGCCYMLVRNNHVYKTRIAALNRQDGSYDRLPSYNAMMWQLFTWHWPETEELDADQNAA